MAGGSRSHNRIEANLFQELANTFEGSPYLALTSNQLVTTFDGEVAFFPDAVVLDGEPETIRYGTQHGATNPAAVFEIALKSTREYDEGRKLEVYRAIPTMREIFLLESDSVRVVRWSREGGEWRSEAVEGLKGTLTVLGVVIPMARLYRGVKET